MDGLDVTHTGFRQQLLCADPLKLFVSGSLLIKLLNLGVCSNGQSETFTFRIVRIEGRVSFDLSPCPQMGIPCSTYANGRG